ncbi:hypothetical protein BT63DRAFT_424610 [Microthyrium microscopicum]|uniref:Uncharacterized protein n=1 Tax=Microthyrium microscopicum TaxID=703497 RepID=A0A6A6UEC6_9PEZI|nr:hypothetical protein BT63DRAFT_424610 [Microthyrium microscopicum]
MQQLRSRPVQEEFTQKCQKLIDLFVTIRGKNLLEEFQNQDPDNMQERLDETDQDDTME